MRVVDVKQRIHGILACPWKKGARVVADCAMDAIHGGPMAGRRRDRSANGHACHRGIAAADAIAELPCELRPRGEELLKDRARLVKRRQQARLPIVASDVEMELVGCPDTLIMEVERVARAALVIHCTQGVRVDVVVRPVGRSRPARGARSAPEACRRPLHRHETRLEVRFVSCEQRSAGACLRSRKWLPYQC